MWIVLLILVFLFLDGRSKSSASAAPGPTSEVDPNLTPSRPRTVAEEAEFQAQKIMDSWRNELDGGSR